MRKLLTILIVLGLLGTASAQVSEIIVGAVTPTRPVASHCPTCLAGTVNGTLDVEWVEVSALKNRVYSVGNQTGGEINAVDVPSFTAVLGPTNGCSTPNEVGRGLAVVDSENKLFVSCQNDVATQGTVRIYNLDTFANVANVAPAGSNGYRDIIYISSRNEVWVAASLTNPRIDRINANTNAFLGSITLTGDVPFNLEFVSGASKVYMGGDGSTTDIDVISTSTLTKTGSISTSDSGAAAELKLNPTTGRLWAFLGTSDDIDIINTSTDTVLSTIPKSTGFGWQIGARATFYSPANEMVVTNGGASNIVNVFDASNNVAVCTFTNCANPPVGLTFGGTLNLMYLSVTTGFQRAQ